MAYRNSAYIFTNKLAVKCVPLNYISPSLQRGEIMDELKKDDIEIEKAK